MVTAKGKYRRPVLCFGLAAIAASTVVVVVVCFALVVEVGDEKMEE